MKDIQITMADAKGKDSLYDQLRARLEELDDNSVLIGVTVREVRVVEVPAVSEKEAKRVAQNWQQNDRGFFADLGDILYWSANAEQRAIIKAAFPDMWEKWNKECEGEV